VGPIQTRERGQFRVANSRLSAKPDLHTEPYTDRDLEKLFAVCTPYYKVVFTLLLSTGMRFREASHLIWTNVLR
jgi:integrase